jgi:arginase
MRNISIIEIAAEFGAGTRGSSLGLDALRFACLNRGYRYYLELPYLYIEGDPDRLLDRIHTPKAKRIDLIVELHNRITNQMQNLLQNGQFPLVISGDHSNAAGTVAALKKFNPGKRIGIVWIDAHGDLHTPYSSPSGNVHGMPVAALLNLNNKHLAVNEPRPDTVAHWEQMCNIGGYAPKVLPQDLVFIGIRDLEAQEWTVMKEQGITHFTNTTLNEIGALEVVRRTKEHLAQCDLIYVSFDVDSFDGAMVPGTGTPVEDGLSYGQARILLRGFWDWDKLGCMEITEINPLLDYCNETAELVADLLDDVINPNPA